MHLKPRLSYTLATVRVWREEDELLLKVEVLWPQCCHLFALLVLFDAHFVLDVCSMVHVLQHVERFHEVTVGWSQAPDHHSPAGNVTSLSLQWGHRFLHYMAS